MTPETVMNVGRQALELTLLISGPLLIAALALHALPLLPRDLTQINEMTLSFIPKLVAILMALVLAGPWMITLMVDHMRRLYESLPFMIG